MNIINHIINIINHIINIINHQQTNTAKNNSKEKQFRFKKKLIFFSFRQNKSLQQNYLYKDIRVIGTLTRIDHSIPLPKYLWKHVILIQINYWFQD